MCLGYCLIRETSGIELKFNFSATTNWFKFRKPFQIFDKFSSRQYSACTRKKFSHSYYGSSTFLWHDGRNSLPYLVQSPEYHSFIDNCHGTLKSHRLTIMGLKCSIGIDSFVGLYQYVSQLSRQSYTNDARRAREIKSRIVLAWAAFSKKSLLKSKLC